jgi:hypothetical protein
MPIQIACSIYDDAKYQMSRFYYDCIDKYIDRQDFQYVEMDTDSAYMALTGRFNDLIKPSMKDEFDRDKINWFPRTDTKENAVFDKRKAGLFKIEFIGSGIIALNSKVYYVKGFDGKDKFSSKGVQKSNNSSVLSFKSYKEVLYSDKPLMVLNRGMRILNDRQIQEISPEKVKQESTPLKQNKNIYSYDVEKIGLTTIYNKRLVLSDNISTVPLNI